MPDQDDVGTIEKKGSSRDRGFWIEIIRCNASFNINLATSSIIRMHVEVTRPNGQTTLSFVCLFF